MIACSLHGGPWDCDRDAGVVRSRVLAVPHSRIIARRDDDDDQRAGPGRADGRVGRLVRGL